MDRSISPKQDQLITNSLQVGYIYQVDVTTGVYFNFDRNLYTKEE